MKCRSKGPSSSVRVFFVKPTLLRFWAGDLGVIDHVRP